jgi:Secretion system C-terminal sorting domain
MRQLCIIQSKLLRLFNNNNLVFLKMKKIFYLFLLLSSSFTIKAATITVTSGADAGVGTLRAAITSAIAGDTIAFSGVTTVTLTSGQLTINKNLTINGGTGVTITRSGVTEFRIFNISSAMTVVFNKLSITNGKAAGQAGGIQNNGNLTLNDCIVANNQSGQGGGLQNDGTLTMNRCFVHSNTMTAGGGGCGLIIYSAIGTTNLNNCVFTNNQLGWAIDIQSTGTLNITNCTIAKNTGGINVGKSTAVVTLKNTIVAENTTGANANILNNNVNASSAYNLIGTEGGNGGLTNGTNNNKVGVSPLFANSSDPDGADNIFGTADDGLMPSVCSPALNAGNNANAPAGTDIVGNMRTFGANVDMGAYEFQASASSQPTITLGTIPAILAGATTFTIPYTATTGLPTTYSISGTGLTTVTDAALPNSPISVNLIAAASTNLSFTLTVKNAGGCAFSITGSVSVVQSITWTGAVSTDWNNAGNWSPNSVPTATDPVIIRNVTNKPVILSGTIANCLRMNIEGASILTINSGGTLNVLPTNTTVSNNGINIFSNCTLTNNGTLNGTTTANVRLIVLNDNTTFNNNGTVNLNTPIEAISMGGPNTNLNNNALGSINFQSPKGIGTFTGQVGNIISNQGIMNFTGSNYFIVNPTLGLTINNSGTIDLKSGLGMIAGSATVNNLACGKILMLRGTYENNATTSITTNSGLIIAERIINNVGNFTNTGILKYNTLTGTITNSTNSVVVNNTTPIFTYNGTYNGTINGIFTDSLATVSAGTFAAPNTFTPLTTLPKTAQTLYAKITPSGGACSYSVPFTYNNTASPTKDLSNVVKLHQNRPNPFSQETIVSFDLIETNKVVLTVYDIIGRQVFVSNKTFNIGYNEVILDKSIFKNAGTYFYRLTSDTYSVVKKLQFVGE